MSSEYQASIFRSFIGADILTKAGVVWVRDTDGIHHLCRPGAFRNQCPVKPRVGREWTDSSGVSHVRLKDAKDTTEQLVIQNFKYRVDEICSRLSLNEHGYFDLTPVERALFDYCMDESIKYLASEIDVPSALRPTPNRPKTGNTISSFDNQCLSFFVLKPRVCFKTKIPGIVQSIALHKMSLPVVCEEASGQRLQAFGSNGWFDCPIQDISDDGLRDVWKRAKSAAADFDAPGRDLQINFQKCKKILGI